MRKVLLEETDLGQIHFTITEEIDDELKEYFDLELKKLLLPKEEDDTFFVFALLTASTELSKAMNRAKQKLAYQIQEYNDFLKDQERIASELDTYLAQTYKKGGAL